MSTETQLTDRFTAAFDYAAEIHGDDFRKAKSDDPLPGAPYISHPMSVAALVLEYGGTEDEAIGALLHDLAEDHGGEAALSEITARFGEDVSRIVRNCSDALPAEGEGKEDWQPRKERYIASQEHKPLNALFVSCADKVHNARSILRDHRLIGDEVYGRFKPGRVSLENGRDKTLWYYDELVTVFKRRFDEAGLKRGTYLAEELENTVGELHSR